MTNQIIKNILTGQMGMESSGTSDEISMCTKPSVQIDFERFNFDFIGEDDLMRLLNKGRTWVWIQRNAGKIRAYKVGKTNFYKLEEVNQAISNGIWDAN